MFHSGSNVIDQDDHFWRHYLYHVFTTVDHYRSREIQKIPEESNIPRDSAKHESVETEQPAMHESPTEPVESVEPETKDPTTEANGNQQQEEPHQKQEDSVPIPIEAPQSTIPEVVQTVEDIYDFDGLSGSISEILSQLDIEKEMSDVEMDNVSMGDIDDIEKEILDEL